jgi:hypothetical protein
MVDQNCSTSYDAVMMDCFCQGSQIEISTSDGKGDNITQA